MSLMSIKDQIHVPILQILCHRKKSSARNALHASSAVNANDLAVDPLAVLGSEEANNAGTVDGLADALHG